MPHQHLFTFVPIVCCFALSTFACADEDLSQRYEKQIKPLFQKHCVACHNDDDEEGGLSLDSFKSLLKGAENGVALIPGDSKSSLLARAITGQTDSLMPPEDEGKMSQTEIQTILDWIDAGARGPEGEEPRYASLIVPNIAPVHHKKSPVADVAWSPDGKLIAVARFRSVELLDAVDQSLVLRLPDHDGKINRIAFSNDGQLLVTASGITGLKGTVNVFAVPKGELLDSFESHRDAIYGLAISHDRKLIATSSYDRSIFIHDLVSGETVNELSGHNGAVYDLDFNSDSTAIASASGDETLKVWSTETGGRLDTLGQPLEEQFVARFSPDDRFIAGAGRDNRIRIWRFVSKNKPRINQLRVARFGHEQPIVDLAFSSDSKLLVSVSEDRTIKVWSSPRCNLLQVVSDQPAICSCVAIAPDAKQMIVGRLDGSTEILAIQPDSANKSNPADQELKAFRVKAQAEMKTLAESEPNNEPTKAQQVMVPIKITGTIHSKVDQSKEEAESKRMSDNDMFRFAAKAGQQFVLETNARRQKSPLDTHIEVLDHEGNPVPRVKLRAVRDSYFTFRGKDSNTSDDFRVHNWEEMELNEFLYSDGEVVKLWHYPRGPDSGFRVYPGSGNRWTYFDTSPVSHALQAPAFIVEPVPPDAEVAPNGLPVFTVNYENDDESMRRLGSDSRLLFTAPHDGEFIARVRDVRGFEGESFKYDLVIRHARPDFSVKLNGLPQVDVTDKDGKKSKAAILKADSPREFVVTADRTDGFTGPIRVDISGLPEGIQVTSPLIIESEQIDAIGLLYAAAIPADLNDDAFEKAKVTATAMIDGEKVVHDVAAIGRIQVQENPRVVLRIAGPDAKVEDAMKTEFDDPIVLTIQPGETIPAKVFADRKNFTGIVDFGKDESGHNMPHGVFVDNIGLNGLMILPDQSDRTFYITAAEWVQPQERLFHLRANSVDGECSLPVILKVIEKE